MSSPPPFSDPRLTLAADEPRPALEIETALDALLDAVLSSRRTATHLAQAIAGLERAGQDFVLHWVSVVARTNAELAFQFAAAAPAALGALDLAAAEAWVVQAMDVYDHEGLHRGSQIFRNAGAFVARADGGATLAFEDVAPVLQLFVQGLSGRRMRIDSAPHAYTDTEALFLPPRMSHAATRDANFLVYKVTAAVLWAQSRYGTYNADLLAACADFPDPAKALTLLAGLETVRLEGCIARSLPGLAREMAKLRGVPVNARCASLLDVSATVGDSIALLGQLYAAPPRFDYPYRVACEPEHARRARDARVALDKSELQASLARLLKEHSGAAENSAAHRFSLEITQNARADGGPQIALALDGIALATPPEVARLVGSILQDLGEMPDDYLMPAGDGGLRESAQPVRDPPEVWKESYREEGIYSYNEWDHRRRHYRKNWCVLRESDVPPGDLSFVEATRAKHRPQIAQLKRTFELLRTDERLLKRQPEGDGIDLDALIEAYADMRHGDELASLIFTKRQRAERDLAVMFMVDMSGSTKGWINDAEREALVMLCEALEALGDRYAIYGFSGMTRKRCEIFRVKRFEEPYGALVQQRIAGIKPQDYTRMGAAIRHLTVGLNRVEARTKLLVTLSDGKPDDYSDSYRGEYGIEDTRQALLEAHRLGIKPFCITIDREARDYLPHMYGSVNWILVDDVARLPVKVADIYRRLTT